MADYVDWTTVFGGFLATFIGNFLTQAPRNAGPWTRIIRPEQRLRPLAPPRGARVLGNTLRYTQYTKRNVFSLELLAPLVLLTLELLVSRAARLGARSSSSCALSASR